MEKPDVLSEKQQENVYIPCEGCELTRDMLSVTCVQCCVGHLLQAQRDDTYMRTRQDTAREIFEILEEAFRNTDNLHRLFILSKEWQSLKSKFLIPPNPVGSGDV